MEITALQNASRDCIKITISTGLSFFLRIVYLQQFSPDRLVVGEILSEEDYKDLENAGSIFVAEHDAMNYIARAEQCSNMLALKLLKKNHTKDSINCALDYLKSKKYLSDLRYAEAWLRNRQITKTEGRIKLESGLLAKGINRNIVKEALDEFFMTTSEKELFEKAVTKFERIGIHGKKLQTRLIRAGFSWKYIKKLDCLEID